MATSHLRDLALRPEVKVIESFHFNLCEATNVAPDIFASLLIQNGLVTHAIAESALQTLGLPDFTKVMKLLHAVVCVMEADTREDHAERSYKTFVNEVLRNDALQLGHIAEPMEDEYG